MCFSRGRVFTKLVLNRRENVCVTLVVNKTCVLLTRVPARVCERTEYMSMTQSNSYWFPLHVW